MQDSVCQTGPASGIHELTEDLSQSPYYSRDMAPTTRGERRWGLKDIAVLWISMSACVPTYMLASSLIDEGMNWWQAVLTIFLGNLIVLVPMVANAHAGTKYGIPFPVYCRAIVRHPGGQRAGPAAGPGRLRLVRHPDLDRRRGALQDPGGLLSLLGAVPAAAGAGHQRRRSWPASWPSGRSTCW